jgi:CDP-diacylglycerol--glycerol-3-phosphate 3-phosphatidyltransferase
MDGSLPGFPLWSMPQMRQTAKRTGIGGRGAIMELNGIPSISARAPMNLPNSITMSRIAMIPLLLWILSPHYPWQGPNGEQELAAAVLFVLASITDGVDGYLARKRSQITTMGMLLDPIADKVMVTAALIALVAYNPQVVKVWIAVVIIAREFLVSGLRSIASSEGFTIEASDLGKLKTVLQIVFVVSAILAHRWYQWEFGVIVIPVKWTAITAIYFTVGVSVISAVDYFVGFWKKIDHASKDRRKSFILSRRKSPSTP